MAEVRLVESCAPEVRVAEGRFLKDRVRKVCVRKVCALEVRTREVRPPEVRAVERLAPTVWTGLRIGDATPGHDEQQQGHRESEDAVVGCHRAHAPTDMPRRALARGSGGPIHQLGARLVPVLGGLASGRCRSANSRKRPTLARA